MKQGIYKANRNASCEGWHMIGQASNPVAWLGNHGGSSITKTSVINEGNQELIVTQAELIQFCIKMAEAKGIDI